VTLAQQSAAEAATANWRWLADLSRTDDALYAGNAGHRLPSVLALQFARVTSIDRSDPGAAAALAALPDQSFDYAVMPGIFDWWPGRPNDVPAHAFRLLRPGGWLALAGNRGARPSRLHSRLGGAGFAAIRGYGLSPDCDRPSMIVPRQRAAAVACERERRRQYGASPFRLIFAALGLHGPLYGGWLSLAAR
jgi:hypothetical protein